MYVITKPNDLEHIPLTFSEVKGILTTRLKNFLNEYQVEDIISFGAFILLESADEITDFRSMLLTEPITAEQIEWVETIQTESGYTVYNICIVRDDIFAVNIFVPDSIINQNIKNIIGRHIV